MNKPSFAVLLVAATAFASHLPASAQTEGNPGFTTPSTRAPEKAPVPNPQDRLFVRARAALAALGRAPHASLTERLQERLQEASSPERK
jgi:hypothetical protein